MRMEMRTGMRTGWGQDEDEDEDGMGKIFVGAREVGGRKLLFLSVVLRLH